MTALAVVNPAAPAQVPAVDAAAKFDLMQRKARLFASSPLIPEHLRKDGPEKAMANCYIALTMAEALNENPLTVLQNLTMISGKAGFASQYMIARANASGMFKGGIGWRVDKNNPQNLSVTAFATLKETGEVVEITVDMAMAQAEGWTKNTKYRTMPEVMLRYRSAAFLVRFYAPHVMLGYHTADELEDVRFAEAKPVTEAPRLTGAALLAQAAADDDTQTAAADAGEPAPRSPAANPPQAGDGEATQGAGAGAAPNWDALSPKARAFVDGVLAEVELAPETDALELSLMRTATVQGLRALEREYPQQWRDLQRIVEARRAALHQAANGNAYGDDDLADDGGAA